MFVRNLTGFNSIHDSRMVSYDTVLTPISGIKVWLGLCTHIGLWSLLYKSILMAGLRQEVVVDLLTEWGLPCTWRETDSKPPVMSVNRPGIWHIHVHIETVNLVTLFTCVLVAGSREYSATINGAKIIHHEENDSLLLPTSARWGGFQLSSSLLDTTLRTIPSQSSRSSKLE